jgi:hypothetical protein
MLGPSRLLNVKAIRHAKVSVAVKRTALCVLAAAFRNHHDGQLIDAPPSLCSIDDIAGDGIDPVTDLQHAAPMLRLERTM